MDDSDSSDFEIIEVQQTPENTESLAHTFGSDLKDMKCPICLETPEIVAVAACGHVYCHECIYPSLTSARNANRVEGECSICRKRVRYMQTSYMEFKLGKKDASREENCRIPVSEKEEGVSEYEEGAGLPHQEHSAPHEGRAHEVANDRSSDSSDEGGTPRRPIESKRERYLEMAERNMLRPLRRE